MDIDVSALKALVREKDLSLDLVVETSSRPCWSPTTAPRARPPKARVTLDRKTGHVTVWAAETDEDGAIVREFDDTPDGFGRIAATTAKQVLLARLREAEGDATLSEFTGREGDLVSGVVQQSTQPAHGARRHRQGRGEPAARGAGAGRVLPARHPHQVHRHQRAQGLQGPAGHRVAHAPDLVKQLFALEVPEIADGTVQITAIAREAGHRTKIAVKSTVPGVNAKGACIGPLGQRVRQVMAELNGEKIDIVDSSDDPAEMIAPRAVAGAGDRRAHRRPGGAGRARDRPRLPAVARHRPRGAERPARRAPHRLADRHPVRHRPAGPGRRATRGPATDRPSGLSRVSGGVHSASGSTAGPRRTCVGCRERAAVSDLIRVVAVAGACVPDPERRLPGRGAHLHPDPECLDARRAQAGIRPRPAGGRSAGPGRRCGTRSRRRTSSSTTTAAGNRPLGRPGPVTVIGRADRE